VILTAKRLAPGGEDHHLVVPGGAWHLHTAIFKAERDVPDFPP
jgi:hypothetical protein